MFNGEKVGAVIVAAGSSRRMKGKDKIFADLSGRSVLSRVLDTFEKSQAVDDIILVLSKANVEKGRELIAGENWTKIRAVCPGGERRQDSVQAGLDCLDSCEWVVIQDGARPLVTGNLIEDGLEAAEESGAAIAAIPVTDTVKIVGNTLMVQGTPNRRHVWAAQTPQVFRYNLIREAYRGMFADVTDDASVVESTGGSVKIYQGSNDNIKITTQQDIAVAEIFLRNRS